MAVSSAQELFNDKVQEWERVTTSTVPTARSV